MSLSRLAYWVRTKSHLIDTILALRMKLEARKAEIVQQQNTITVLHGNVCAMDKRNESLKADNIRLNMLTFELGSQPKPNDGEWQKRFQDLEEEYDALLKSSQSRARTEEWQESIVTKQALRDLKRVIKVLVPE